MQTKSERKKEREPFLITMFMNSSVSEDRQLRTYVKDLATPPRLQNLTARDKSLDYIHPACVRNQ